MNPRYDAKADTYILAWRGILHGKELNRLTMARKLRQNLLIQAQADVKRLKMIVGNI